MTQSALVQIIRDGFWSSLLRVFNSKFRSIRGALAAIKQINMISQSSQPLSVVHPHGAQFMTFVRTKGNEFVNNF
jgi:hypothetical protein